jgi:hypothetical protein
LLVVCEQDTSVLAEPAYAASRKAPRGELFRVPGGHYAPFLEGHEAVVQAELSFLAHHLLNRVDGASPGVVKHPLAD